MAYAVELTLRAGRDLEHLYEHIAAGDSIVANRWFEGLEKAICTLERFPRRCPRAPEARKIRRPLRHLLYGDKPDVYRALYEIDEPRKFVRVLTIRYGAMDELMMQKRDAKKF